MLLYFLEYPIDAEFLMFLVGRLSCREHPPAGEVVERMAQGALKAVLTAEGAGEASLLGSGYSIRHLSPGRMPLTPLGTCKVESDGADYTGYNLFHYSSPTSRF